MLATEHLDDLLNRDGNVVAGDKIGSVGQVYADDDNGRPVPRVDTDGHRR